MRNLKKVLSLALVFVMVFALMVSAGAAYSDQDKIENKGAVELITALQIMTGRSGAFDPTANVQRGEMAKMIYIAMNGVDDKAELYATLTNPFTDVGNTVEEYWGVNYVKWANYKGVISGKSPTMFYPKDDVKGIEAAKMILVAMGFDAVVEGYQDNSNWEFNIAEDAKATGLLEGLSYDCLKRPLTRDEAALMVANGLRAGTASYEETLLPNGDKVKVFKGFVKGSPLTKEVFELDEAEDYLLGTKDAGIDGFSAPVKDAKGNEIETITLKTLGSVQGAADSALLGHKVNVYYKTVSGAKVLYGLFDAGTSVERTELKTTDASANTAVTSVNGKEDSAPTAKDGVTVKYIGTVDSETGKFTWEYALYSQVVYGTATLKKDAVTDAKDNTVKYDGVDLAGGVTVAAADLKASDVKGAENLVADTAIPVVISWVYESGTKTSYSIETISTVEGYVSATSTVNGKTSYTINGNKYTKSEMEGVQAIDADSLSVQNAKNYRYYVVDGKIVFAEGIDSSVATAKYMVIFNFTNNEDGTDDVLGGKPAKNAKVYALLQDGKLGSYEITGLSDGTKITESHDVKTYIGTAALETQQDSTALKSAAVVPYELDTDGNLIVGKAITLESKANIAAPYNKGNIIKLGTNNFVVEDSTIFFIKTGTTGTAADYSVYTKANVPALSQKTGEPDQAQWTVVNNKLAVVFMDSAPKAAGVTSNQEFAYVLEKHTETALDDKGQKVTSYFATGFNLSDALVTLQLEDETAYNGVAANKWYTYTTTDNLTIMAEATLPATINSSAANAKTLSSEKVTAMDANTITLDGVKYEIAANCVIKTLDKTAMTVSEGYTFKANDDLYVVGNNGGLSESTAITEIYFIK